MPNLTGVEWLNQNALRAYPLHDEATRYDTTGSYRLPDSFLVDLQLCITFASPQNLARYHVSEVAIFGQGVVVTLAYTDELDVTTVVGSVGISASAHQRNQSYFFYGTGDFSDVVGVLTVGVLTDVLAGAGTYTFDLDGARLVPSALRPDVRSLSYARAVNGADVSDPIYGVLDLVSGANVVLDLDSSGSDNVITVNVVPGENLAAECGCVIGGNADRTLPPCIRTINGVPPTAGGNMTIAGGACLTVEAETNGIRFTDTCAQPCCTGQEVQALVDDLNNLAVEIRTDHFLLSRLETKLGSLEAAVRTIAATGFIFG